MDALRWFKLEVLYKITSGLYNEELSEIDEIRLKAEKLIDGDGYEKDLAFFNLGSDTIIRIHPCAFVPMGNKNKKFYSEVVFESGDIVYADGKPADIYDKLNDYYKETSG